MGGAFQPVNQAVFLLTRLSTFRKLLLPYGNVGRLFRLGWRVFVEKILTAALLMQQKTVERQRKSQGQAKTV